MHVSLFRSLMQMVGWMARYEAAYLVGVKSVSKCLLCPSGYLEGRSNKVIPASNGASPSNEPVGLLFYLYTKL